MASQSFLRSETPRALEGIGILFEVFEVGPAWQCLFHCPGATGGVEMIGGWKRGAGSCPPAPLL